MAVGDGNHVLHRVAKTLFQFDTSPAGGAKTEGEVSGLCDPRPIKTLVVIAPRFVKTDNRALLQQTLNHFDCGLRLLESIFDDVAYRPLAEMNAKDLLH